MKRKAVLFDENILQDVLGGHLSMPHSREAFCWNVC